MPSTGEFVLVEIPARPPRVGVRCANCGASFWLLEGSVDDPRLNDWASAHICPDVGGLG